MWQGEDVPPTSLAIPPAHPARNDTARRVRVISGIAAVQMIAGGGDWASGGA